MIAAQLRALEPGADVMDVNQQPGLPALRDHHHHHRLEFQAVAARIATLLAVVGLAACTPGAPGNGAMRAAVERHLAEQDVPLSLGPDMNLRLDAARDSMAQAVGDGMAGAIVGGASCAAALGALALGGIDDAQMERLIIGPLSEKRTVADFDVTEAPTRVGEGTWIARADLVIQSEGCERQVQKPIRNVSIRFVSQGGQLRVEELVGAQ